MCSGVAQRWSCFGIVLKMRVSRRSWGFLNHLLLTPMAASSLHQQCRSSCIIWFIRDPPWCSLSYGSRPNYPLSMWTRSSTLTWKSWLIPICTTHLMVYSYGNEYQRTVRVDLVEFHQIAAGNILARAISEALCWSNLLADLDQDLLNGLHAHVPILLLSENRLWWELKLSCTHQTPNRKGTRPTSTWEASWKGPYPSWRWSRPGQRDFFHAHLFSDQT